jgi:hypothetical protein
LEHVRIIVDSTSARFNHLIKISHVLNYFLLAGPPGPPGEEGKRGRKGDKGSQVYLRYQVNVYGALSDPPGYTFAVREVVETFLMQCLPIVLSLHYSFPLLTTV